jgi:hypothetical protein
VAERFPAMYGRLTLTAEVSISSMIALAITAQAMSQRYNFSFSDKAREGFDMIDGCMSWFSEPRKTGRTARKSAINKRATVPRQRLPPARAGTA